MTHPVTEARMTSEGIGFTVRVDFVDRECFISNEALAKLSGQMINDPMETFRAMEATITGVARRLVHARVGGAPLVLGPNTFNNADVTLRPREA
jgi:Protein of unknown function (DUF1488)